MATAPVVRAGEGQNWFGVEGFSLLAKEEYEIGHYRIASILDPTFVTETISAACTALKRGTEAWLIMGKHTRTWSARRHMRCLI